MSDVLRLYTLGGMTVLLGDKVLNTEIPSKMKAMLVYLCRVGQSQPRDKLTTLLWTDSAPERAGQNFRAALVQLREYVTTPLDVTRTEIAAEAWLDANAFEEALRTLLIPGKRFTSGEIEALADALALYRGDFLLDVHLPDASAFDEWITAEREALRQRFITAASRLLAFYRDDQQHASSIDLGLRLLIVDPLHEPAHRALMESYARTGERTLALQQFERFQSTLWDELGVEPEDETLTLYEQIAAGEIDGVGGTLIVKDIPNNLPGEINRFLGREQEVSAIIALLKVNRCVTLVGTGGIGKTRLVLKIAEQVRTSFPDGVFWVELASLVSTNAVAEAISNAMDLRDWGEGNIVSFLSAFLREKCTLLVLDNFEHVLDAAPLVDQLLRAAPALHVLITSREGLHLYGETIYDVPPLPRAEAQALFLERARAVNSRFEVSDSAVLDTLCMYLDDLPLALELAASQARTLSLAKILARLDAARLGSTLRGIPDRQRTLFNTIEWSYELLTPDEQRLYRRLAFFVGTWTAEAGETVGGDPLLDNLFEKSLLRRSDGIDGEPRYSMLETTRQHARLKLDDAGETRETLRIYLSYAIAFAEAANLGLRGLEEMQWQGRLTEALDNLHAAIEYAAADPAFMLEEARLVAALGRYWYSASRYREARFFGERVLRYRDQLPAEILAGVLSALGGSAFLLGERADAEVYHREALSLYETVGDLHGQAYMNMCVATHTRDLKDKVFFNTRAYNLFHQTDEISLLGAISVNVVAQCVILNRLDEAERVAREGLIKLRGTQTEGEIFLLYTYGSTLRVLGNFEAAFEVFEQCYQMPYRIEIIEIVILIEKIGMLLMIGENEKASIAHQSLVAQTQGQSSDRIMIRVYALGAMVAYALGETTAIKTLYQRAYAGVTIDRFVQEDFLESSMELAHLAWYFAREGWFTEAQTLIASLYRAYQQLEIVLGKFFRYYFDLAEPLFADHPLSKDAIIPDDPFVYAFECLERLP